MLRWKSSVSPRSFSSMEEAKRDAQKRYSRKLNWTEPRHSNDGWIEVIGSTGEETDDKVYIRQTKRS